MTHRLSATTAVVIAVLLVAMPIAGAATAATAAGSTTNVFQQQDANETETQEYRLENLQKSGDMKEQDMESLRVLGSMETLWMLNYEVGINDNFGDESSEQWLGPGDGVGRNQLRLEGNFPYDGETREYTAEIVYYTGETRRVETENGTTTERYANISAVDTQDVSFEPGFQSSDDISLRPHYEDSSKVVVHLLDEDGTRVAKWGPYVHNSVQTTASLPFSSWGEFIPWLIKFFLLTSGVGAALAVGGGYKIATETGGFGKGLAWWALVSGLAGGIAMFVWFAELVTLIVALPFLLAVPVVFGVFIVTVEVMQPTEAARLETPNITETESAVGSTRAHIEGEHADSIHVFERSDGLGFIKFGSIRAALARKFAGMAIVPWDRISKRYKTSGSASETEKFYVKDYEFSSAGWRYDFPDLIEYTTTEAGEQARQLRTDILVGAAVAVIFGAALGNAFFNAPLLGGAVGLLPVLAVGLEPYPGDIDIEFADGAQVSAKAARLTETEERLKYDSIDAAIKDIASARTNVWKELQRVRQEVQKQRDKTTDEMYEIADNPDSDDSSSGGVDVGGDDVVGEVTGDD